MSRWITTSARIIAAVFLVCCVCIADETASESASETVAVEAVAPFAGTRLQSGLQPGDKTFAFHVQDVTGPRKGRSLCYACAFGKHTVVNIQARKIDAELIALLKQLDALVDPANQIKGDSQHAFLVYLTEDPDLAAEELNSVAKEHGLKNIPLTIYDELDGPKPYKLSREAEVTVMLWAESRVTANFAFADGGLDGDDVPIVLKSVQEFLKR